MQDPEGCALSHVQSRLACGMPSHCSSSTDALRTAAQAPRFSDVAADMGRPPSLTPGAYTADGARGGSGLGQEVCDELAYILAGQLLPLRESLKIMQESIVGLTRAIHAMESWDLIDVPTEEQQHGNFKRVQTLKKNHLNNPEQKTAVPQLPATASTPPAPEDGDHVDAHAVQDTNPSKRDWNVVDAREIARPRHEFEHALLTRVTEAVRRFCNFVSERVREPTREGRLNSLVTAHQFQDLSCAVIMLNAVFVAHTSEWEMQNLDSDPPPYQQVCERVFLFFYSMELILRLLNHRCYFFVNSEWKWNIFDLLVMFMFVFDAAASNLVSSGAEDKGGRGNISFMRIFRLLKLAKILRTLRVMRVFRDLSQILESFKNCAISLFWSFFMILFVIYVFALIFLQGLTGHLKDYDDVPEQVAEDIKVNFGTMLASMTSLYKAVTGGNDWCYYSDIVKVAGSVYELLFLLFIFFFVFALLSILTGVFVEKAVVAAQPDREEVIMEQRRKTLIDAEEFEHICHVLDVDKTGTISRAEFMESMKNELMTAYMASRGIELRDFKLFFDMIGMSEAKGTNHDEIPIDRFADGCMAMKGFATNLDLQKLTSHILEFQDLFRHKVQGIDTTLKTMQEFVGRIDGALVARQDARARSGRLVETAHSICLHAENKLTTKAEL